MATRTMDDVAGDYADLSSLKVDELVKLCKKNRLSTKYRLKPELVKRLGQHFSNRRLPFFGKIVVHSDCDSFCRFAVSA